MSSSIIHILLFSYTTMYLNFIFLDPFLFELSCKRHTHTEIHTHTNAHKDSDEYSIVILHFLKAQLY